MVPTFNFITCKMLSIRSLFKKAKKPAPDVLHIALDETTSTNQYCLAELCGRNRVGITPYSLAVITAEYQSLGRGQGANTWESERGQNLLFSILCHPVWVPVRAQFCISECIALAIRDVLSELTGGISIKWPNDIYWRDRKICGILIENRLEEGRIRDCVVGVGINVNQQIFRSDAPNPVSLLQILGHETDRRQLLDRVIQLFRENLEALRRGNYAGIAAAYASHLYRADGFHAYRDAAGNFEAALVEVEEDGHLILRDTAGSIRSYAFKEVEFVL